MMLRYSVSRDSSNDVSLLTALAVIIGQSVATTYEVKYGLGRHIRDLSAADIRGYQKVSRLLNWLSAAC